MVKTKKAKRSQSKSRGKKVRPREAPTRKKGTTRKTKKKTPSKKARPRRRKGMVKKKAKKTTKKKTTPKQTRKKKRITKKKTTKKKKAARAKKSPSRTPSRKTPRRKKAAQTQRMPVASFSGLDTLAGIFAHPGLPRLIRFFLFNPTGAFSSKEIGQRTKLPPEALTRGIQILKKVGMVRKSGMRRLTLDQSFPHIDSLRQLLFHPETLDRQEILKRLKSVGTFRLIAIGGLLAGGDDDEAVDILLVGDRINDRKLIATLRALEAETGKELTYALLTTREFHYRLGMHDKLIRLVLEGPHQNLVNRLGL